MTEDKELIRIHGAKNSALAIIAATLLSKGIWSLNNIPMIADVCVQFDILRQFNVKIKQIKEYDWEIDTTNMSIIENIDFSKNIRGSYYFMGVLNAYASRTIHKLSNGCNIDDRTIDIHLDFFSQIGVSCEIKDGDYVLTRNEWPKKKEIEYIFKKKTVGGTVNAILSTVVSDKKVLLKDCAIDPYITDLINFLNKAGSSIHQDGDRIYINGTHHLNPIGYTIMFDPIEAGTYLAAIALLSKKPMRIGPMIPSDIGSFFDYLIKIGVKIKNLGDCIYEVTPIEFYSNFCIATQPFPGIYTDLQLFAALLGLRSNKISQITENIMLKRFEYLNEIKKIGYQFKISDNVITIFPSSDLNKDNLELVGTDLRGTMAILLACLMKTNSFNNIIIHKSYFIDRGYYDYKANLSKIDERISKIRFM